MSRRIPHRELRNNSSQVLREVQAGETVEITNHGEVVAVLVPAARNAPLSLRMRKATVKGGFSDLPRARLPVPAEQSLEDLREDR